MNILFIDPECTALDFALRCQDAGHEVQLWIPKEHSGDPCPVGKGLVPLPDEWQPLMGWADLVLPTTNSKYANDLEPFFKAGYPIVGANKAGAELELDREVGQQVLEECGIECLPNRIFSDYDEAIEYVKKTGLAYVSKPWGGNADKAMTYVSKSAADMVFKLQRWKSEGKLKGQFMLQEKIDGIEMGVGCWFGPGGWSAWIEENWEEKKLMNDGLGCNTGEQGTVMRYVKSSALFDRVLEPVVDYLHEINYVGCVDMNCMVDEEGTPWPLEFTMRFGWPAFNLQTAALKGDPAQWMVDLLNGKDTMRVSEEIIVGVVMTHGDFPYGNFTGKANSGFPIYGITSRNREHLHFQSVMDGVAPMMVGEEVKDVRTLVTAGDYVLVATGLGATVQEARRSVYRTCWAIDWPSNRMFRTDIGERLRFELPKLQEHGFALGMRYA